MVTRGPLRRAAPPKLFVQADESGGGGFDTTAVAAPRTRRMNPAARNRLVMLFAVLIAGSVLGVLRLIVDMQINGQVDYTWVFGIIAFDAIVLVALAFYTRTREQQVSDLEQRLATRAREQGSSRGG